IRRAQWDDSERRICSSDSLQHIVNGTVPTTRYDGIEPIADRHTDLGGSVGRRLRWRNFQLDPCSPQNRSRRFHIFHAVLFPSTRERIVKKCGFAHERWSLCEQVLPRNLCHCTGVNKPTDRALTGDEFLSGSV